MQFKNAILLPIGLCALVALASEARQSRSSLDEQEIQNEIDDRIRVGEPYKSLLQTTARFALAQTKISNHINMDVAMNLLNDAGFRLAKTSTLVKVVKAITISLATLIAATFFFPGAYQFADALWRNPANTLNLDKYFANGFSDKSVIMAVSSRADETLNQLGLQQNCREQSLCHLGQILKCTFPQTADSITKFASDNFTNAGIRDSVYARAFVSGFVDNNCTKISADETRSCLGNFVMSIFEPLARTKRSSTKKQSR